jgi:hypothetical protein
MSAAAGRGMCMAVGTSFVCKCCGMQGRATKQVASRGNQTDDYGDYSISPYAYVAILLTVGNES